MSSLSDLRKAFDDVLDERKAQDRKFPHQAPGWPIQGYGKMSDVLMEEVGEVSKARLEDGNLYEELTHVAAVAIKWMQIEIAREREESKPETIERKEVNGA